MPFYSFLKKNLVPRPRCLHPTLRALLNLFAYVSFSNLSLFAALKVQRWFWNSLTETFLTFELKSFNLRFSSLQSIVKKKPRNCKSFSPSFLPPLKLDSNLSPSFFPSPIKRECCFFLFFSHFATSYFSNEIQELPSFCRLFCNICPISFHAKVLMSQTKKTKQNINFFKTFFL